MARIREYEFVTGIETSTTPDPATPSADTDSISLGYLNELSYWGASVASYAALRALDAAQRRDYQTRKVQVGGAQDWYFDDSSTATDDGAAILKPDDLGALDPGRWLIVPGGSGGGGGGGASGLESLIQKLENERFNEFTDPLDNSVGLSGAAPQDIAAIEGNLIEDATSSDTTLILSWDTKFLNDSDKNVDATTNWAVGSAGASLTTSVTRKVGATSLQYDKNGSSTTAYIEYDRGSANLYINSNSRLLCWVNLPSITQLTNVFVTLVDNAANSRTWPITTVEGGGGLAIGWNLISVDLSDTTGTTTGGSGVTINTALRYVRVGVTTSVAGQTYTAILVDGPWFSARYANKYGFTGAQVSLFNNSTSESVVIDSANTRFAGTLTLAAGTANAYTAGFSNTDRARVKRTTLTATGDDTYSFNNDGSFSGAITLQQSIRAAVFARGTVSGDLKAFIDTYPTQSYVVTGVSGSNIDVEDSANQSANLVSGDTVDVFAPLYADNGTNYTLRQTTTLSGNSSHLSGTTTCPLTTPGSIAVGDILCKRLVTSAEYTVTGSNESFGSMTLKSTPDGIQLVNMGADYPNRDYVWGHWFLGASNDADALKNRYGVAPSFTKIGSPNLSASTLKTRFGITGMNSASNYLQISAADSNAVSGDSTDTTRLAGSIWVNITNDSTQRAIVSRFVTLSGWAIFKNSSNQIVLRLADGSVNDYVTATVTATGWYHIAWDFADNSGSAKVWVNGTQYNLSTGNCGDAVTFLYVGSTAGIGTTASTDIFFDYILWRNAPELTSSQVNRIYNGGNFNPVGVSQIQRYVYENTGLSGQRLAVRAALSRTTTAVRPAISKMGIIVS